MADIKRARKNTFESGISPEEVHGAVFNVISVKERGSTDTLYSPGVPSPHGVPLKGTFDDPEPVTACVSLTKKGFPCKAPLVKGERMCVGHLRAHGQGRNT